MSMLLSDIYNNNEGTNKENFAVQTWKWPTFSKYLSGIDGFYTALMELVTNSIDAVRDMPQKKIDITIEHTNRTFVIEDTGYGMSRHELKRCVQWAESDHKGLNNVHGTGDIVALSFLDPRKNGSFAIATRLPGSGVGCFVSAPFGPDMNIEERPWRLSSLINTHVETLIDPEVVIPSTEEIIDYLGLACYSAISDALIHISINGQDVLPIVPGRHSRAKGAHGSEQIEVNNKKFTVRWTTFELEKGGPGWDPCQDKQAVYLFGNLRMLSYEGLKLIRTATNKYHTRNTHDTFNSLVTFVRVDGPQEGGLPVNSCKTCVNWSSSVGKKFRDKISELISDPYKSLDEAETRCRVENILKHFGTAYVRECRIIDDPDYKKKVDAVMFNVSDKKFGQIISNIGRGETVLNEAICKGSTVGGLVEWKKKDQIIGDKEVGQLIGYISLFWKAYGYIPKRNIIIGKDIEPSAQATIDLCKKLNIEFVPVSKLVGE